MNKSWFAFCLFIVVCSAYSIIREAGYFDRIESPIFLYGLTTLVKIKSALAIPNNKTLKTKILILPLITQGKPRNFWWDSEISRWWYMFFKSNLNMYPSLPSKYTQRKVSKYGVFSGPYLGTFHAVIVFKVFSVFKVYFVYADMGIYKS